MRRLALVLLLTACASPTDVQSDVQNDVQSVRVETRYVGKLAWNPLGMYLDRGWTCRVDREWYDGAAWNVHSVCVKP